MMPNLNAASSRITTEMAKWDSCRHSCSYETFCRNGSQLQMIKDVKLIPCVKHSSLLINWNIQEISYEFTGIAAEGYCNDHYRLRRNGQGEIAMQVQNATALGAPVHLAPTVNTDAWMRGSTWKQSSFSQNFGSLLTWRVFGGNASTWLHYIQSII